MTARTAGKFFQRCTCCVEPSTPAAAPLDRRAFMAGGLAAFGTGLAAASAPRRAFAQGASAANPRRIDIHHHFSPPQWIAYVERPELPQAADGAWTPEKSIDDMDKGGVA